MNATEFAEFLKATLEEEPGEYIDIFYELGCEGDDDEQAAFGVMLFSDEKFDIHIRLQEE